MTKHELTGQTNSRSFKKQFVVLIFLLYVLFRSCGLPEAGVRRSFGPLALS